MVHLQGGALSLSMDLDETYFAADNTILVCPTYSTTLHVRLLVLIGMLGESAMEKVPFCLLWKYKI